jgi:hypothetical protein
MHITTDLLVDRRDPTRTNIRSRESHDAPGDGEILVAIDRFVLTANNLTYALLGDSMGFWSSFPADPPWGRVPAWGHASVVASRHPDVAVGERAFGLMPMSTHLALQPVRVTARAFSDGASHRARLHPLYNRYALQPADAAGSAREQILHAGLHPLFATSFALDEHLAESGFHGAQRLLLSSASSKTALGTAFLLRERHSVEVVGLTSMRHARFVHSTGCYDRVLDYETIDELGATTPSSYVDFSGDRSVREALTRRLGRSLVHDLAVGLTHQGNASDLDPWSGRTAFFGPAQLLKRRAERGTDSVAQRMAESEAHFAVAAAGWLRVVERKGLAAAAELWQGLVGARSDPGEIVAIRVSDDEASETLASQAASEAEERAALSILSDRPSAFGPRQVEMRCSRSGAGAVPPDQSGFTSM